MKDILSMLPEEIAEDFQQKRAAFLPCKTGLRVAFKRRFLFSGDGESAEGSAG